MRLALDRALDRPNWTSRKRGRILHVRPRITGWPQLAFAPKTRSSVGRTLGPASRATIACSSSASASPPRGRSTSGT